jgi:hypothetical protein
MLDINQPGRGDIYTQLHLITTVTTKGGAHLTLVAEAAVTAPGSAARAAAMARHGELKAGLEALLRGGVRRGAWTRVARGGARRLTALAERGTRQLGRSACVSLNRVSA